MVLILSLEQHVAVEVEDALPPVVRLEHLDELLARQLIPSTRAHDHLQPHVGAQQALHGGLAAQRAEELGRRTLGLRELGAAHDALEIVEVLV